MYHAPDARKALEPPLPVLFGYLKEGQRIRIYLNQNNKMVLEGKILGFDEFMNIVLGDAVEVYLRSNKRFTLGTTMLRGECVGLIHGIQNTIDG